MTLITGDRVVVTGRGHRVHPGPGRQDVGFTSQVRGEHLYVIPSDAHPLISRGVLDQRLFDVTQLLKWRYGDEAGPPGRSAGLPNPRAEGLVSLRATVTGAEGAGLTQTVIRAYAVG